MSSIVEWGKRRPTLMSIDIKYLNIWIFYGSRNFVKNYISKSNQYIQYDVRRMEADNPARA